MNDLTLLFLEAAISVVTSLTILQLISASLRSALTDLCPTQQQANFWLSYTRTMLLIAPLLMVLFINSTHTGDLFNDLRSAFIAILSGLILGLIIIGKKMYIPVDRQILKSNKGEGV